MLRLTRMGDYAIRAVLQLALAPGREPIALAEVAESQNVPRNFLSKILQTLARHGIVESQSGARGGYFLARPAESICVKDVVEAIEGPIALNLCLIRDGACSRQSFCPVHNVWKEVQEGMTAILERVTFDKLAAEYSCTAYPSSKTLRVVPRPIS